MPASAFPRRLTAPLLLLTLALAAPARAQGVGEALPETRAAWVLDGRFRTPADAEATIRRLADAGFNLALVRVWYQGATIYPSAVVQNAGGPRQHAAFAGYDALADLIAIGRRHGVRIGAWMEYGLAEKLNAPDTSNASTPPILRANPGWAMRSRTGQRAYDGSIGFQYWMDPAVPAVRAFVRDLCVELVTRYPDLTVLEYDRFRYPTQDFSYSATSLAAYQSETVAPDPRTQPNGYDSPYGRWRRSRVTRLAGEVYRAVKAVNPAVVVTAAVGGPGTYEAVLQEWPVWADSGYVDGLEPMLYATDAGFANLFARASALVRRADGTLKKPLYPGIGADNGSPAAQTREARRQGAAGVTVWYEGSLTDAQAADLRAGPFAQTVLPDFDDVRADDGDAGFTLQGGPWTAQAAGYGGDSRRIEAGAAGAALWRLRLPRYGPYEIYARWPAATGLSATARLEVDGLGDIAEPATYAVNQRVGGGGWVRVGTANVGSGFPYRPKDLLLGLHGSGDGAVIADAVRFVRVAPFRAEEVLAMEPRTVEVRFTYAPLASNLVPANFRIDGAVVASVEANAGDGRIVRLVPAAPLAEGTDHTLTVEVLRSSDGYGSERATLTFRLDPAAERLVDDGDAAFSVAGEWASASGGEAVGAGYRTAPAAAGTRATWSGAVGGAGRYDVEVYFPAGVAGVAERMGYQVGSSAGFTTVTVAAGGRSGWARIGTFDYRAGATAVVLLQGGLSAPGTLVADAVRFRRTLATTAADPGDAPGASGVSLGAFPNPARARLTLRLRADAPGAAAFTVYDALGREVLRAAPRSVSAGESEAALDVAGLPAGLYVVRATVRTPGRAPRVATRTFTRLP